LMTAVPAARALDVDLKVYDEARRRGETVSIAGRVYTERRKPNAEDMPMAHAVVVALPRSEALVRRLDDLRARARDSAPAYREVETAPGTSMTLELNDRNVWFAGIVEDRVLDAGPSR